MHLSLITRINNEADTSLCWDTYNDIQSVTQKVWTIRRANDIVRMDVGIREMFFVDVKCVTGRRLLQKIKISAATLITFGADKKK